MNVIGSNVNGKSFGYSTFEVPPGQTKDISLQLHDLPITNSTSYDAKLTFTFEDGVYQVYEQTVTPKKYSPGFIIKDSDLTPTSSNSIMYNVTLQNTGNIPMVDAKVIVNGAYQTPLHVADRLEPKETVSFSAEISLPFKIGDKWTVEIEAVFIEGSTFSAESSFSFK